VVNRAVRREGKGPKNKVQNGILKRTPKYKGHLGNRRPLIERSYKTAKPTTKKGEQKKLREFRKNRGGRGCRKRKGALEGKQPVADWVPLCRGKEKHCRETLSKKQDRKPKQKAHEKKSPGLSKYASRTSTQIATPTKKKFPLKKSAKQRKKKGPRLMGYFRRARGAWQLGGGVLNTAKQQKSHWKECGAKRKGSSRSLGGGGGRK